MRKTKIICTLGPAIDSDDMLREMIRNGLDCARLNFSHGSHEEQLARIERVKRIRKEFNKFIPILLDTKGPEIRLRKFVNDFAVVEEGQFFTLFADERDGDNRGASVTYPDLAKVLRIGTKILIDDGKVEIEVDSFSGADVVCKVINGGRLSNNKSINIPGCAIDMPYISERDRSDLHILLKTMLV